MLKLAAYTSILALALLQSSCRPKAGYRVNNQGDQNQEDQQAVKSKSHPKLNAQAKSLLGSLYELAAQQQFIFGHQKASLAGIGAQGGEDWDHSTAQGRTSDVEHYIGQKAGIIGLDTWDLAIKDKTWNRDEYAQAIHDFYADGQGGVITLDYHMRGCSEVQNPASSEGYKIKADGSKEGWASDPNRDCLCKIVNEMPGPDGQSWKQWYLSKHLDAFYNILLEKNLTEVPLIFRPFHEQTASWFWWGAPAWNCDEMMSRPNPISGPDAYKALFRMTVDHLREQRGLKNILFAYSTDKLCQGHQTLGAKPICDYQSVKQANQYQLVTAEADLQKHYLSAYPGNEYVDILGIDLYYERSHAGSNQAQDYFAGQLRMLSKLAKRLGKVAALTETGDRNLPYEANGPSSQWFMQKLLPLMRGADINLAFVLLWENKKSKATTQEQTQKPSELYLEYFIPHRQHAGFADFQSFERHTASLFFNDLREKTIYNRKNTQAEQDERKKCSDPSSDEQNCTLSDESIEDNSTNLVQCPDGSNGRARGFGNITACGNKQCAQSDSTNTQSCVINLALLTHTNKTIGEVMAGTEIKYSFPGLKCPDGPNGPSRGYGDIFACPERSEYRCAKTDSSYTTMCHIL